MSSVQASGILPQVLLPEAEPTCKKTNMARQENFSFGKNWRKFQRCHDEQRVASAQDSLTEFLGCLDLKGKSFVDVGCGSGLFSCAAFKLGASPVVSFDVDPFSVECCRYLHELSGSPSNWKILEGSILDSGFVSVLETYDVVYSWGVLHHTGNMWEALANSARLVQSGGRLYIAIYNRIIDRNGATSWIHGFWSRVKKTYNRQPIMGKYVLEPAALAAYVALVLARGENPVAHVRNYRSHRGMNWRTDATDWLGGYPYEYATVEEVFTFMRRNFPTFNLENIRVTNGRGLNWYLFHQPNFLDNNHNHI